MINEDYVSFETAKLLKEKGFDEPCYRWYNTKGEVCAKFINPDIPLDYSSREYYLCPSQSMAMKWLREVHYIFIQVELYSKYNDYWFELFQNTHRLMIEKREVYNSYEQACEEAIKYCLENLI